MSYLRIYYVVCFNPLFSAIENIDTCIRSITEFLYCPSIVWIILLTWQVTHSNLSLTQCTHTLLITQLISGSTILHNSVHLDPKYYLSNFKTSKTDDLNAWLCNQHFWIMLIIGLYRNIAETQQLLGDKFLLIAIAISCKHTM